jgi:hypothetical protein
MIFWFLWQQRAREGLALPQAWNAGDVSPTSPLSAFTHSVLVNNGKNNYPQDKHFATINTEACIHALRCRRSSSVRRLRDARRHSSASIKFCIMRMHALERTHMHTHTYTHTDTHTRTHTMSYARVRAIHVSAIHACATKQLVNASRMKV